MEALRFVGFSLNALLDFFSFWAEAKGLKKSPTDNRP
jgi:hypothetical protein